MCASVASDGRLGSGQNGVLSANGRYVAYTSSDITPGTDAYLYTQVYVRDLQAERTILASAALDGQPGNGSSDWPSISADGRYVAFESQASNLVEGDTNQLNDIFVYDRKTGVIVRASVNNDGSQSDEWSQRGVISASGSYVVYWSGTRDPVFDVLEMEGAGVFLHNLNTKKTLSISKDQGFVVSPSSPLAINADGRFIVFEGGKPSTNPNNLDAYGLYLYDHESGKVEFLVKGLNGEAPDSPPYAPSISANGRYIAFDSSARNLVKGDSNKMVEIFVQDRESGAIQRVSIDSHNLQADFNSLTPAISADGQHVVFVSEARNLTQGYPRGAIGVFIHDISNWDDYPAIDARRFSQATPYPGPYPPPTRLPVNPNPYPGP